MKKMAVLAITAVCAFAASVEISFDHPDFDSSRRGVKYEIPCTKLAGERQTTVAFQADISTWGDILSINVLSDSPGRPIIHVDTASKSRVAGTMRVDVAEEIYMMRIVVTKTNGGIFEDSGSFRIYNDSNGTCPY